MWCWKFKENGDLSGMDAVELADAAGFPGDENRFLESLVARGWLDDGPLRVHDWFEHTGKIIGERRAEAERGRRRRAAENPESVHRTSTGRPPDVHQPSVDDPRTSGPRSTQLRSTQIEEIKIPPTPHGTEPESSSPDGAGGDEDGGKGGQTPPETVAEEPGGTETPPKASRGRKTPKSDLTPEQVAGLWNTHKHPLQPGVDASRLNPARKRKLAALLDRHPTAAEWEQAIGRVAEWEFGQGANDSRWIADFDWLLGSKGERAFDGPLQAAVRRRLPRALAHAPRSAAPELPPLRVLEETVSPQQQAADLETLRAAQAALNAAPRKRT
jgi:hypothetical protein